MPRVSIPGASPPDDESNVNEARRTALTAPADPSAQERAGSAVLPERYEDLRLLGSRTQARASESAPATSLLPLGSIGCARWSSWRGALTSPVGDHPARIQTNVPCNETTASTAAPSVRPQ